MKPIFKHSIADEHFARLRKILGEHTPAASAEQLRETRAYERLFARATLSTAAIAAVAILTHQASGLAADLTQAMGLLADYVAPAAAIGWLGSSVASHVMARKLGLPSARDVGERGDEVASLRAINETLYKTRDAAKLHTVVGLARQTLAQLAQPDPMEVSVLLLEVERRMGSSAALDLYSELSENTAQNIFVRATTVGIEMRQAESAEQEYNGPQVTKIPYAIAEDMHGHIAFMVFAESLPSSAQDAANHLRFAAMRPHQDGMWHARDVALHKNGHDVTMQFGTRTFVFENVPDHARRCVHESTTQVILVPPVSSLSQQTQDLLARIVDPDSPGANAIPALPAMSG